MIGGPARAHLATTILNLGTREIGFTGGEPFMSPHMLGLIEDALARGFEVLVLTNVMQPMQRPRVNASPRSEVDRPLSFS